MGSHTGAGPQRAAVSAHIGLRRAMTPGACRRSGCLGLAALLLTLAGCGSSPAVLVSAADPATPDASPSQTPGNQNSCGPRPAPATSVSLETRLSFPDVVTAGTTGQLTVRNAGSATMAISPLPVVTANGESITSGGVMAGDSSHWYEIEPGQEQRLAVFLSTFRCTNGRTDTDQEIPDGEHQLVAVFMLRDGQTLASSGTDVTYRKVA